MVVLAKGALSRPSRRLVEHELSHDNIEILNAAGTHGRYRQDASSIVCFLKFVHHDRTGPVLCGPGISSVVGFRHANPERLAPPPALLQATTPNRISTDQTS